MNARLALVLCLLSTAGCAALQPPTLAQKQANWRNYRKSVRFTCSVGMQADRSMPEDVMDWCVEVAK